VFTKKKEKKKIKNHARVIFHLFAGTPHCGDRFEIWLAGSYRRRYDVITHAKFCDNLFRGFEALIHPILPLSIGIAGRPYNSVSTTVLHCDENKTETYQWHLFTAVS